MKCPLILLFFTAALYAQPVTPPGGGGAAGCSNATCSTYTAPGGIAQTQAAKNAQVISVVDAGAAGNAKQHLDGYITGSVGAAVLNSPSAPFVAGDVTTPAKIVQIQNSCLNGGVVSTLEGTITSFANSSTVGLAVDTASSAHGIVCAAINNAPLLGTTQVALTSSSTTVPFYWYYPTAIPTPPFNVTIGSGTGASETVSATAVTLVYGQSYTLTTTLANSHPTGQSILLGGTQAVQYAYGTDDTAAINLAISNAATATAVSSSHFGIYFPSSNGGYMVRPANKGAVTNNTVCMICVNGSNITLYGDPTTIYAAGAWSLVGGVVMRGRPIGIAQGIGSFTTLTDITVKHLAVEGMTSGNTDQGYDGVSTTTGEGWDTTNQCLGLYAANGTENILIDDFTCRHTKGEQVIFNGQYNDVLTVQNSHLEDTNGDSISTSAIRFTAINNTLSNTGNDNIENGLYSNTPTTIFYNIANNRMYNGLRGSVVLAAVTNSPGALGVLIHNNDMVGCGTTQAVGHQGTSTACVNLDQQVGITSGSISNAKIFGNRFKDFIEGIHVNVADRLTISGNTYTIDTFAGEPTVVKQSGIDIGTANYCNYCQISNERFNRTAAAVTASLTYYPIRYLGNTSTWTNVVISNNVYDTGQNPYNPQISGSLATTWAGIASQAAIWKDNTCLSCPFSDAASLQAITSGAPTIYPTSDWVYISETTSFTATITTTTVQDGSKLRITNSSAQTITFTNDANIALPQGNVTINQNQEATFAFSGTLAKWQFINTNGGVATSTVVPVYTSAPAWLRYLGTGASGAENCNGNLSGEQFYATFTVSLGSTCTNNSANTPLIVHATGACTIAGTVTVGNNTSTTGSYGGSGAGGGGGAGTGSNGSGSNINGSAVINGGAGGTTGNNGSSGNNATSAVSLTYLNNVLGSGIVANARGGGQGGAGGSSGGAPGNGGGIFILECQSITFTGTVSAAGANGTAGGSNTGGGGGGGGGMVLLSAQSYPTNTGTINVAGGNGGAAGTGTSNQGGPGGNGMTATLTMQ